MMQSDEVRTRQFNLRLTEEELALLAMLANQHGVTPSDFFRYLLHQAGEQAKRPRLAALHFDILAAMAKEPKKPMSAVDLLQPISRRHQGAYLGQHIYNACVELEHLRMLDRSDLPGRSWLITDLGTETQKGR